MHLYHSGCGKTTQRNFPFPLIHHAEVEAVVPQVILDSLITSDRGSQASILVTQPRRLSAISVATRVSEERLNDGSVGYSIRGESKISRDTRLLFCTIGVVLRRLSTGDNLQDVSHIVVDEVSNQVEQIGLTYSSVRCTNGLWMAIFFCLS